MKAQAAFEYMLVFLIVIGFMIPVWTYTTGMKTEAGEELSLTYARSGAEKLASTSDLIYSQGAPARARINLYIPEGVVNYTFVNRSIVFRVRYFDYITDVVATSKARMNGTLPLERGSHWIRVEAVDSDDYDISVQPV